MKEIRNFSLILMFLSSGILIAQTDTAKTQSKKSEVFTIVEDQPVFPGGVEALMSYLATNIEYPRDARESNIQGTVFITFVIEMDGSVSSVRCLRGIGGGCDEEAMRVVKLMPKWKPGYQRGKPVRVQFNLPIRFILEDDTEKNKKSK